MNININILFLLLLITAGFSCTTVKHIASKDIIIPDASLAVCSAVMVDSILILSAVYEDGESLSYVEKLTLGKDTTFVDYYDNQWILKTYPQVDTSYEAITLVFRRAPSNKAFVVNTPVYVGYVITTPLLVAKGHILHLDDLTTVNIKACNSVECDAVFIYTNGVSKGVISRINLARLLISNYVSVNVEKEKLIKL